jgi:cytochrome c biogenesis protein CcdA
MKKLAIYMLRFVWMIAGFAIVIGVWYVTAVFLGEVIPAGTSGWVRLAIGVPVMFAVPVSVELLYIAISKWFDRKTNRRFLGLN